MAYTGTGTQADPFVVDNYHDLRTVCSSETDVDNKYIELDPNTSTKIMNITADERYAISVDTILPLHKVMHINGNGWKIMNGHTTSYNLIDWVTPPSEHSAENLSSVENLKVVNHVILGSSATKTCMLNASSHVLVDHCSFSALYKSHPGAVTSTNVQSVDCSYYARFTGASTTGIRDTVPVFGFYYGSIRNNIEVHKYIASGYTTTSSITLVKGSTFVSLYGDIRINNTNSRNFYLFDTAVTNSIAALSWDVTDPTKTYTFNVHRCSTATGALGSIVVTGMPLNQYITIVPQDLGISVENAKNEDALIDIGFLP